MTNSAFWDARIEFLRRVAEQKDGAQRKHVSLADRKQDRVRQSAKIDGLATYTDRGKGMRWFITPKGREYLKAQEGAAE